MLLKNLPSGAAFLVSLDPAAWKSPDQYLLFLPVLPEILPEFPQESLPLSLVLLSQVPQPVLLPHRNPGPRILPHSPLFYISFAAAV